MNKIKTLKILILFFTLTAILSCKTDDNGEDTLSSADLIGAWQRSDATEQFVYTLTFQANDIGFREVTEVDDQGQAISSLTPFEWSTANNRLTIDYGSDVVITGFSFNDDDHLLLSDLTELYFIPVN